MLSKLVSSREWLGWMLHTVVLIVEIILGIAAIAGLIAGVAQLFEKKNNNHKPKGIYELLLKRVIDVFLSTGALIVLSPIIGITALLVRIKHGSPVVYTQERPGRDEKIFKLYKFRTMTNEKDRNGELLPDSKRLTKFGSTLRQTSLEELLELINIIKGDMSIIGPRPLLVQYLPYYTENEKHRHDVRPGLSGLAQISGRNLVGWDQRLAYDTEYVGNITFIGDLKIILKTIEKVFRKEDVAVDPESVDEGYLDQIRGGDNNS